MIPALLVTQFSRTMNTKEFHWRKCSWDLGGHSACLENLRL